MKAEAGVRWKRSERGICGDRVLQGSQLRRQTPSHGILPLSANLLFFFFFFFFVFFFN